MRPRPRTLFSLLLVLAWGLVGRPAFGAQAVGRGPAFVVAAAASLHDVIDACLAAFARSGGGPGSADYGASSLLVRRIEQGEPAELMISADETWMDELVRAGLVQAGTRRDLLGNDLVLIASRHHRITVDLNRPGSLPTAFSGDLAIGDPALVPAGTYAQQSLERLGSWAAMKSRLLPAEDVRAALRLVELGEADAGIVYGTDARSSSQVIVVGVFPPASHEPIRYPIALLTGARPQALAFLAFLEGPVARKIFLAQGFTIPDPGSPQHGHGGRPGAAGPVKHPGIAAGSGATPTAAPASTAGVVP